MINAYHHCLFLPASNIFYLLFHESILFLRDTQNWLVRVNSLVDGQIFKYIIIKQLSHVPLHRSLVGHSYNNNSNKLSYCNHYSGAADNSSVCVCMCECGSFTACWSPAMSNDSLN